MYLSTYRQIFVWHKLKHALHLGLVTRFADD